MPAVAASFLTVVAAAATGAAVAKTEPMLCYACVKVFLPAVAAAAEILDFIAVGDLYEKSKK